MNNSNTKCGYVTIIGKPNAGKSTLLNLLTGFKFSIVTSKAGTTRHNLFGVTIRNNIQVLFIDTPGLLDEKTELDAFLKRLLIHSIKDIDLLFLMTDINSIERYDEELIQIIKKEAKATHVVLIINKMDLLRNLSLLEFLKTQWTSKFNFKYIIPISALQKKGIEELWKIIEELLPQRPFEVSPENVNDVFYFIDKKIYIAEIIREKLLKLLHQEVPHSCAIVVDSIQDKEDLKKIYATIFVERDSQKGIIIGKNGSMIKKIGIYAREELEHIFNTKIFLKLYVKVVKNWRKDPNKLKQIGYMD